MCEAARTAITEIKNRIPEKYRKLKSPIAARNAVVDVVEDLPLPGLHPRLGGYVVGELGRVAGDALEEAGCLPADHLLAPDNLYGPDGP